MQPLTHVLLQENVSHDLEAFAQHASRKTVTADDVMLLTRRNEGLEGVMREFRDEVEAKRVAEESKPNRKAKGRTGRR